MGTLSFVCITCGGTQYTEDRGVRICRHCGNRYNTTSIDDGLTAKLQYAMNERQEADFDKARRRYDAIISETEGVNDAACEQACWGKFLCEQYVIFYRNDADEAIPSFWNINDDKCEDSTNYLRAIKYGASSGNAPNYEKLAKLIELYKQKYRKVKQEIPKGSEIFICFKDTGTTDRNLGYTLYNKFSGKYDIFFSPESLNSISGNDYEPYIYHALTTAKVLIVICSSREALESKWVHNEWWRFVNFAGAADKTIIPVLRNGFTPNQLPYEIKNCQVHEENVELISNLEKRLNTILPKRNFGSGNPEIQSQVVNAPSVQRRNKPIKMPKPRRPIGNILTADVIMKIAVIATILIVIGLFVSGFVILANQGNTWLAGALLTVAFVLFVCILIWIGKNKKESLPRTLDKVLKVLCYLVLIISIAFLFFSRVHAVIAFFLSIACCINFGMLLRYGTRDTGDSVVDFYGNEYKTAGKFYEGPSIIGFIASASIMLVSIGVLF